MQDCKVRESVCAERVSRGSEANYVWFRFNATRLCCAFTPAFFTSKILSSQTMRPAEGGLPPASPLDDVDSMSVRALAARRIDPLVCPGPVSKL